MLSSFGIKRVVHYTPLHYLPFISREGALLAKTGLSTAGFTKKHFRSKSAHHDKARGFEAFVHLTTDEFAPILRAKLAAGFPHVAIIIPSDGVEKCTFDLCRFNIAMTRHLRRGSSPGYPENAANGRYYDGCQVPIARSDSEKRSLLAANLGKNMIELLVHARLELPAEVVVQCFHEGDLDISQHVLGHLGKKNWASILEKPKCKYPRNDQYVRKVKQFVTRALDEPKWSGDGLEFDKV